MKIEFNNLNIHKVYKAIYKIDNPDSHRDGRYFLVTKFELKK
jgi:hypothetical protein